MSGSTARRAASSEGRRWCASNASRWLLLLPAIAAAQAPVKEPKTMEPTYIHWYQALSMNGAVMTAIAPEWASADVSANLGTHPEVGYYQAALPRARFEAMLQLMDATGFDTEPNGPPVVPDTAIMSFGKTFADPTKTTVRGWAVHELPPKFVPLRDAFSQLTEELRAHAVRAVRGTAAPVARELSVKDVPAFEVTLTNVGREAVKLNNPFHKQMEEQLTVRLMVRRNKPWEQLRETEQLFIECAVGHIRMPDPKAKPPEGRKVKLAPGESLRFVVRKPLQLAPGDYVAQIVYLTTATPPDPSALRGELALDTAAFTVRAP